MRTRGVWVDDIDAVIDGREQFRQGGNLADVGGKWISGPADHPQVTRAVI